VRRQGLVLRPDWEAVLTPVADAMAARADVDAARMGVIGLDDAGYGVLRTLAFEHRFAAAVADPGVVDASTPWTQLLPDAARAQLLREAQAAFDREIHLAGLFAPELHRLIAREGPWYGAVGTSPYALYREALRFRLGDAELDRIATPLLLSAREPERRWPGQAVWLQTRLAGRAELLRGAAGEDADVAIADWLADALAPRRDVRGPRARDVVEY